MALDQWLQRQQTKRKIRKVRKLRGVLLGGADRPVRLSCGLDGLSGGMSV
jgi:hypothetical protein